MKIVSAKTLLESNWPLSLAMSANGEDESYDGSCPCCIIHGEGFEVEMHCWRSSCGHGCPYSCIHVTGSIDKDTKQKIAECLRDNNGWTNSTEWNIIIE